MPAVASGPVLPAVLVRFIGAVIAMGFDMEQHHLGSRIIIPQQQAGNPVCFVGNALMRCSPFCLEVAGKVCCSMAGLQTGPEVDFANPMS